MNDRLHLPDAFEFVSTVEQAYHSLMEKARSADAQGSAVEPGLGGQLFYAGELDERGRQLVVAGNVAGAATLCATADVQAQKRAVREGVIDFLVTSLDEAVRILKNQIRKRETVAVCVGIQPAAVELQMVERGVQPDVRRVDVSAGTKGLARRQVLVTWQVEAAPVIWMPKLDGLALECIDPEDGLARRWIRLAPKYLGRSGQVHLVHSTRAFAERFTEAAGERVQRGEIGATRISVRDGAQTQERQFVRGAFGRIEKQG